MAGFAMEPRDQERYRKRGKVNIYYVGLAYHQAHGGLPPPIYVKTTSIDMPELGEHLRLDEVWANDIIARTRFRGKPIFLLESEGGSDVAQMLIDGDYNEEDFETLQAKHYARNNLSRDDLLALLGEYEKEEEGATKPKRRKVKAMPKQESDEPESNEEDT